MPSYLGQNFLKDVTYINVIVKKIQQYIQEYNIAMIVEIGPGKGALTKKIIPLHIPLLLLEKDHVMAEYLVNSGVLPHVSEESNIEIILGDVLQHKPEELIRDRGGEPQKTLIAGNLPYYITSPIMLQFFG